MFLISMLMEVAEVEIHKLALVTSPILIPMIFLFLIKLQNEAIPSDSICSQSKNSTESHKTPDREG